jgi:hypothetical protein
LHSLQFLPDPLQSLHFLPGLNGERFI